MPMDPNEIDILMGESDSTWGMDRSLFCLNCGYNLRGLPYSGLCPECGNRYNARDYRLEGIFLPRHTPKMVPIVLLTLTTLGLGLLFLFLSVKLPGFEWFKYFSALFLAMAVPYCWYAKIKISEWIRYRRILHRMMQEEEEWE